MWRVGSLAILLALGLSMFHGRPAQGQAWLAMPGQLGAQTVSVGHATLKLPPGQWQPVASSHEVPLQLGGASMEMETKWLAQISGGRVAAIVRVRSNLTRSARGWRSPDVCSRHNVAFFLNRSEADHTYDCMVVSHRLMTLGDNPGEAWAETFEKLKAAGDLPQQMVVAVFSQASGSRLDFIEVTMFLNPTLSGFPDQPAPAWAASEWNKLRLQPDHKVYIDRVATWAEGYHGTVADAF